MTHRRDRRSAGREDGGRRPAPARFRLTRRGVVSVLSMMFLVLFGSLVAAMAVASQGNTRAAGTHLHVMRAMGAAETGLAVGAQRLTEAAQRFVVSNSEMDAQNVWKLWTGDTSGLGDIEVLPPPSGHPEAASPAGVAEAVALIHAADQNIILHDGVSAPVVTSAPAGTDPAEFKLDGWVVTPVIGLDQVTYSNGEPTTAGFQIIYAPRANGTDVRVIAIGYDFGYRRQGRALTRVVSKDYRITKQVRHAIVSPNRVMIGKNVSVTGDLGIWFDDINFPNAQPLLMKSDFYGLDPVLDQKLDDFYEGVAEYDVDGDNRLRVSHPIERLGIPDKHGGDYGGSPEHSPFADATGDGYVDEFDIFINHFDQNNDAMVALSDQLRAGTPNSHLAAEFIASDGSEIDKDLAILIDSFNPDRNRNGVWGFDDLANTGWWDPVNEPHFDTAADGTVRDQVLGFRDGVLDRLDRYVKLQGSVKIGVTQAQWNNEHGDWRNSIRGAIRPAPGNPPLVFAAGEDELPRVSADTFIDSELGLKAQANGQDFWQQVADNLGVSVSDLETYVETTPQGSSSPRYIRLDPDTTEDGLPDNYMDAYFEKMPFNAPVFVDWYYRPVFENMVFRNTQIPKGLNALFVNCEFIGVTWVRTQTQNSHPHWSLYGRMGFDTGLGRPVPAFNRDIYGANPGETADDAPPMLPPTAVPPEENILLARPALDKGDILQSEISSYAPGEYDRLPEPLVIDGKRVVDTKKFSNNLRFHDCLFVGSIVSDKPQAFTHVRNKIQFTGKTRFTNEHPDHPADPDFNPSFEALQEIVKSSMMLPHYSVDVGTFNSPPEQNVQLRGVIVAGILDVRGNANIEGAILLTFQPRYGEPPLVDVFGNPIGNPGLFNCTIGYFGPEDGDEESIDPRTLPKVDGVKIVGYDTTGDGLADVGPFEDKPDGSTPVPFHGYGRITIRFDPLMSMPNGIMLPLSVRPIPLSYREGAQ